jgi:hypothetical protein
MTYRVKDFVVFGRPNGEQTIGRVLKVNIRSISVETLEARGQYGQRPVGQKWRVVPSLLRPATEDEIKSVTSQGIAKPAVTSPTPPANEAEIMREIANCYCALSPENLTCDGELSMSQVRARRIEIVQSLKRLFVQLGRTVDEAESFQWEMAQRKRA